MTQALEHMKEFQTAHSQSQGRLSSSAAPASAASVVVVAAAHGRAASPKLSPFLATQPPATASTATLSSGEAPTTTATSRRRASRDALVDTLRETASVTSVTSSSVSRDTVPRAASRYASPCGVVAYLKHR